MPRWNSCNILQVAPDANRLWQFEAKGNFKLNRELRTASDSPIPANLVAKSWNSFWQPKLNIAWLPAETVFLRVIELPKGPFNETVSMVELQLEKLSPMPVTQIAWTMYVLPQAAGDVQTVIVVMVSRSAVEQFLGQLEGKKYLADRLDVPLLDELEAMSASEDSAWICPAVTGNPNAALVAWWYGGVLRNVSFLLLPNEGDRATNLKSQLAQLVWAGELEGWLITKPKWHLMADGVAASEWETLLKQALDEPVNVSTPLNATDLAARTARRATQSPNNGTVATLLPAEFSQRYREQFHDRLWLHGLYAAGIAYLLFVIFYFSGTYVRSYQNDKIQQQVAGLADSYTNAMQLQARYGILQQREDLKFAALDCWKLVADYMPDGVTLQRFSFGGGRTLALYGTAPADQLKPLDDFYSALQKSKNMNGEQMFSLTGGEPLSYHLYQNSVDWNFSLELKQGEKME
jgi:hypothetical protein